MSKTHYRNVFKSDHLGSADLEDLIEKGSSLCFTIKEVKQEWGVKVAGKKGDHDIAYFHEKIKPLVLNATNCKQLAIFTKSRFVEDWAGLYIELYIDENVKSVTGGITQGVRIRPVLPQKIKQKPIFSKDNFEKAKIAEATKEQIELRYTLPPETYQEFLKYCQNGTEEQGVV